MRARCHAGGLLEVAAQVAGDRLLASLDGLGPTGGRKTLGRVRALVTAGRIGHVGHGEWMHVDVAVWAVLRAQPAPDAPVLDDDLERLLAADRSHGAPDHA